MGNDSMESISEPIRRLLSQREKLRKQKRYHEADELRLKILAMGYAVQDADAGHSIENSSPKQRHALSGKPGLICFFGSGELSSIGRKIHDRMVSRFDASPTRIVLLETPTGYEDNPHVWYKKLETRLSVGLKNYHPVIDRIPALRMDQPGGTNDETVLSPIRTAHYIHTGAGSPSYAVKHIKNSKAYEYINERVMEGASVSFASASAIAFGQFVLPVYELYFAGHDPYWLEGIDFLSQWGLSLTFIPHWNNTEGGKDIDTRFSYMGKKRFDILLPKVRSKTTIIGIDEQTAIIFDIQNQSAGIMGVGQVTVIRKEHTQVFLHGQTLSLRALM